MTITLSPYLNLTCDDPTCEGTCGPCGVELSGWQPFLYQRHSECAEADGTGDLPPRIPGIQSIDLQNCLCSQNKPVLPKNKPSDPVHPNQIFQGAAPFSAWWYQEGPDQELLAQVFGPLIRQFTIEDPQEFSASRAEKVRGRVAVVDGRVLAEVVLESTGVTRHAAKEFGDILKRRLESSNLCCDALADIWLGCTCVDESMPSLRRRLTGVSEFHVQEIEGETITDTGVLLSLMFSADTLVEHTDAASDTAYGTVLGVGPVEDSATVETAAFTEFTPRTICTGDIVLQTDGSLKLCPADYETFDPATCYMKPRNVSEVDASGIVPCPLQVNLDLTVSPPIMTPLQPTLFQTLVLDKIANIGTYSATENPITVKTLTVANSDYNPDCPTCPAGVRARECANQAGLVINAAGVIDWLAVGINPATEYDLTGLTPATSNLLSFYQCLGLTGTAPLSGGGTAVLPMWNPAAILQHMNSINSGLPGPPSPPVSIQYTINSSGAPRVRALTASGTITNTAFIVTAAPFSGYDDANPVTPEGEEGSCGDVASHCLPTFKGTPTGTGPCVEITIASNGTVVSSVNPTTDDLLDAKFEFGPAFQAAGTPECPGVIPPKPQLSVNTTTGVVTPIGWTVGSGWPLDTTGALYEITTVDGQPNVADPVQTQTQRPVLSSSSDCVLPCNIGTRFAPQALTSTCWTGPSGDRDIYVATVTGLSRSRSYRPVWSLQAEGLVGETEIFLWTGLASAPSPTVAGIEAFTFGSGYSSLPIVQLSAGEIVSHDHRGLRVKCANGTEDAFAGLVDSAAVWHRPEICDVEVAHLIVSAPQGAQLFQPKFRLVPVSSP